MKKNILLTVTVLLIFTALLLTACGGSDSKADLSDSKYVGTWEATSMSLQDASESMDNTWTLILNEDGTGQSVTEEETEDFTWKLTENGFKTDGAVKLTFTDDGDNVKAKILGVDMTFVKQ